MQHHEEWYVSSHTSPVWFPKSFNIIQKDNLVGKGKKNLNFNWALFHNEKGKRSFNKVLLREDLAPNLFRLCSQANSKDTLKLFN